MGKLKIFIISLTLNFGISESQEIILRGLVLDEITEEPVAYSNVGYLGANKGTVSGIAGNFTLAINPSEVKDLKFKVSRIGYISKEFDWEDYKKSCGYDECVLTILLKPKQLELKEFVLESKNLSKERSFGGKLSDFKFAFAFNPKDRNPNENLGREVGILVDSKKEKLLLTELRLYLGNNQFDKILFRINIRKIGEDVDEVLEIIEKEIFMEIEGTSSGIFIRSLSEHELFLEGRYLISIEWIDYEAKDGRSILTIPSTFPFGKALVRNSSQDNWEKVMGNPGIRVIGLIAN